MLATHGFLSFSNEMVRPEKLTEAGLYVFSDMARTKHYPVESQLPHYDGEGEIIVLQRDYDGIIPDNDIRTGVIQDHNALRGIQAAYSRLSPPVPNSVSGWVYRDIGTASHMLGVHGVEAFTRRDIPGIGGYVPNQSTHDFFDQFDQEVDEVTYYKRYEEGDALMVANDLGFPHFARVFSQGTINFPLRRYTIDRKMMERLEENRLLAAL